MKETDRDEIARANGVESLGRDFFWGKYRDNRFLSLAAHSVDVAVVFRELAEVRALRRALDTAAARALTSQDCDRLAALALYHDIGKANWGFQRKVFDRQCEGVGHIRELGALFTEPELGSRFCDAIQAESLAEWFDGEDPAESLLIASWSHHGRPVSFAQERTGQSVVAEKYWRAGDGRDPMDAVCQLVAVARTAFPAAFAGGPPSPATAALQHRFAGLLMLADWLGSDERWYPVDGTDALERIERSRSVAPRQLRDVGIAVEETRSVCCSVPTGFSGRFGFAPLPLQRAVDDLPESQPGSKLLIAESQTGSGKTEAALHWFLDLFSAGKVDGLYFALPTRVAAQELHQRVSGYITTLFPDSSTRPTVLRAVPGYASAAHLDAATLPGRDVLWQDDQALRIRERTWAAEHPKRFLAATIAVGTVDQALMSAIMTAHAHLRSVCLDRSLLVVDEVHASDTYMQSLLAGLLRHHLGLGGHAMLLSATLGATARSRLLGASGVSTAEVPPLEDAIALQYPALSVADGSVCPGTPKGVATEKTVKFELCPEAFDLRRVARRIREAAISGARVLVVLNTVRRAVALQRLLEDTDCDERWFFGHRGVKCAHHGRFAPADRLVLDPAVSARFGRGTPGGAAILIGTQTLEQSLDIDSDLLVTDLCPADVLLQRVGRLHRHRREDRPGGFGVARCVVLLPDGDGLEDGLGPGGEAVSALKAAGWGSVYPDLRVLSLTWEALREKAEVAIPDDNRWLVERTTHPEAIGKLAEGRWRMHATLISGQEAAMRTAAYLASTSGTAGFHQPGMYEAPFGDVSWGEMGLSVTTRLGVNTLRLELTRPVEGPFGVTLTEITVPGHLAPHEPGEKMEVVAAARGVVRLRCGERTYAYSRFGLEVDDEPADR